MSLLNIVVPKHIWLSWQHETSVYELAGFLLNKKAPIKYNQFDVHLKPESIEVAEGYKMSKYTSHVGDWIYTFEKEGAE